MRAALYSETGKAADVLRVEEVSRPEPGPGEVLVRVSASGVNPTDCKARSGAVPRPVDIFQIPHQDGAGVIEAVGPGVDPAASASGSGCFSQRPARWGTAAVDRGARAAGGAVAGRRVVRTGRPAQRPGRDRALLPVLRRPGERPDRTGGRRCRSCRSLRH